MSRYYPALPASARILPQESESKGALDGVRMRAVLSRARVSVPCGPLALVHRPTGTTTTTSYATAHRMHLLLSRMRHSPITSAFPVQCYLTRLSNSWPIVIFLSGLLARFLSLTLRLARQSYARYRPYLAPAPPLCSNKTILLPQTPDLINGIKAWF